MEDQLNTHSRRAAREAGESDVETEKMREIVIVGERGAVVPVLRGFLFSLLALLAICFAVELVRSTLFHQPAGIYTSFLFQGQFPDLLMHVERFHHFHSAAFFRFTSDNAFMYPAPVAVTYQMFYRASGGPAVAYSVFALGTMMVLGWRLLRELVRRGVAWSQALPFVVAVLLCSYPVLFMIKQGNTEVVVLLILSSGIVLFLSGYGYVAALCFGLAASLKIYPFVFFGLFLRRGQLGKIALGAAIFAVSELGSLWLVCPQIGTSWRGIRDGLVVFQELYMLPIRPEIGADHSLYVWVKLLQRLWHIHRGDLQFDPANSSHLNLYLVTTALAGIVLFFTHLRRLPVTNRIVCLTIVSVWLPPVSFEYTLVQLLTPLGMLMLVITDAYRRGDRLPGSSGALACFVVIFAALPELTLNGNLHSGQVKAVALLLLFVIGLRYPFRDSVWDSSSSSPSLQRLGRHRASESFGRHGDPIPQLTSMGQASAGVVQGAQTP